MGSMKVFISSLISGFGPERQAARRAVETLRYQPIMAEDFGAQPTSPQVACLQGVRDSDLVVLILGERYGAIPPGSSLSATHQEYREARAGKPVVAFVQQGVTADPEQSAFIDEVQGWSGGLFRGGFDGPEDLQAGIIRALHDVSLATAVGPLDQDELIRRAEAFMPTEKRNDAGEPFLHLALAGGPTQRILRPIELEAPKLAEEILQSALFGEHRFFDRSKGSETRLLDSDLVVRQDRGSSIRLNEQGALSLRLPLEEARGDRGSAFGGMMVVIEEMVEKQLATALAYASATTERIDPTQRLTHVAIAAYVSGAEYRAWRTRAQNMASPNSMQVDPTGGAGRQPVTIVVPRAALRLDRSAVVEDLLVPIRRQFPAG
jgi:hypothetical protein